MSVRTNIHPAAIASEGSPLRVPNASPIASRSLFSVSTPGVSSMMHANHTVVDESAARNRAREMMQAYTRDHQRVTELEALLGQRCADNDRLTSDVSDLRRHIKELTSRNIGLQEQMDTDKDLLESSSAALKTELSSLRGLSAQHVSELMAQVRIKDEELDMLQSKLQSTQDEVARLKNELRKDAQNGTMTSQSEATELTRAQNRSIELARKLLESERGKRVAEEALIDDRRRYHQALETIESLRRQLSDVIVQSKDERSSLLAEVKHLRASAEHSLADSERQVFAMREVMRGDAGRVMTGETSSLDGRLGERCSQLQAQVEAQQEQIQFLTDQGESRSEELVSVVETLSSEKAKRVAEVTQARDAARSSAEEATGLKQQLALLRSERDQAIRSVTGLQSLYDHAVSKFEQVSLLHGDPMALISALDELRAAAKTVAEPLRKESAQASSPREGADNKKDTLIELLLKRLQEKPESSPAPLQSSAPTQDTKRSLETSPSSEPDRMSTDSEPSPAQNEVITLRAEVRRLLDLIRKLEAQSSGDAAEIRRLRSQLTTSEANKDLITSRVRSDCAKSMRNLLRLVREIEEEYTALIRKRYHSTGPGTAANGSPSGAWSAKVHDYYYGTNYLNLHSDPVSAPLAALSPTSNEQNIATKIHETLVTHERLVEEWSGAGANSYDFVMSP